jgi:hypothetical protein
VGEEVAGVVADRAQGAIRVRKDGVAGNGGSREGSATAGTRRGGGGVVPPDMKKEAARW